MNDRRSTPTREAHGSAHWPADWLIRALDKLGWEVVAQKGSHAHLKHLAHGGRVTAPLHSGETIGAGLLRSILNQAGVTADELRRVL